MGITLSKFLPSEIMKLKVKWTNWNIYSRLVKFKCLPKIHFSIDINKYYIYGESMVTAFLLKWAAFWNDFIKFYAKRNHETIGQNGKIGTFIQAGQIQRPAQTSFLNQIQWMLYLLREYRNSYLILQWATFGNDLMKGYVKRDFETECQNGRMWTIMLGCLVLKACPNFIFQSILMNIISMERSWT